MLIEILSVCKKNETDSIEPKQQELSKSLDEKGYTLKGVKKAVLQSSAIKMALSSIAKSDEKPDLAIVTGALKSKDNSSFKKYMVESVAASEKAEKDRKSVV